MYFYFSADYPAVIKLNNIYFGKIYDTVKSCKIDLNENTFIEIYPLTDSELMTCFILNKSFIDNPPKNISVTDMHGGYLIKARQTFFVGKFNVLSQAKFKNLNITVFFENGIKISLETPNDFFADNIDLNVCDCEIKQFKLNQNNFVAVVFYNNPTLLVVYSVDNHIQKVFSETINEYDISDYSFSTTINHLDIAKHTVKSTWNYDNGSLKVASREITRNERYSVNALTEKILPFAFLEEFLVGGDINEFLSESMLKNADKLNGYLGDFIGIMPPPNFRNIDEIGLVYKMSENVYDVKYVAFEIVDKKITNIIFN